MSEFIEKLKSMKNSSQSEVERYIHDYSLKQVKQDLDEAGVDWQELDETELNELIADEMAKNKSFAKGALSGAGALFFLSFIG